MQCAQKLLLATLNDTFPSQAEHDKRREPRQIIIQLLETRFVVFGTLQFESLKNRV
jgi:hypothetical protein